MCRARDSRISGYGTRGLLAHSDPPSPEGSAVSHDPEDPHSGQVTGCPTWRGGPGRGKPGPPQSIGGRRWAEGGAIGRRSALRWGVWSAGGAWAAWGGWSAFRGGGGRGW